MNVSYKSLLAGVCLLFSSLAFASGPPSSKLSKAERYARRCQSRAPDRGTQPQGTLLWGTRHAWKDSAQRNEPGRSVLVSVDITSPLPADAGVKTLRLDNGRLVASPQSSASLVGTVLQGSSSDGKPVEIALCGAEPAPDDADLVWYRIEAWNPVVQDWENPCAATDTVTDPRALAVAGVWDNTGAHRQAPGKLTLACENGVISKCIRWGYKPWASRDGRSLADLHQACTRMARADYCGNGNSHTHEGTTIDMYDSLGLLSATTQASAAWDPARASFEAAWAPDGATCVARTRDGRALDTLFKECPGRFRTGVAVDLGQGDHCTVQRAGTNPGAALLRNRSYGGAPGAASKPEGR